MSPRRNLPRRPGRRLHASRGPAYPLSEIKRLMGTSGGYLVRGNAYDGAWSFAKWGNAQIVRAIRNLGKKHFIKSDPHHTKEGIDVDCYEVRDKIGRRLYVHFYVDYDGTLIINSFKRSTSK